jgi:hypothetical protein
MDIARQSPVWQLQEALKDLPQLPLETLHYFADGMYLRWLYRPKGALIIGKVHKKEHFYLVIQGKVQIEREVHTAPAVIVSKPGTKRAVLALEDSVCITIHRTNERDLDKIEVELVEPDPASPYLPGNILKVKELT